MSNCVKKYRQAVKVHLTCSSKGKKNLMQQMDRLMANYLEENPVTTLGDICEAFGVPEDMAKELMQDLPDQDVQRTNREKHTKLALLAMTMLVFIILILYVFFIKEIPIESTGEIIPVVTERCTSVLNT